MRPSLVIMLLPAALGAQTPLGERIAAVRTSSVSFSAHTRANVCGDGVSSLFDGLGNPRSRLYNGMLITHGAWDTRIPPCEHGPMRVTVRVVEHAPSSMKTVVAPVGATPDSVTDLGLVSTADAGTYLAWLARHGDGRASESTALYQLGQLADPRGIALFVELLRSRP